MSRMRRWWKRLGRRTARVLSIGLVIFVFGLVGSTVVGVAAVEHTAQPDFCLTCHIMEPYYESWKHSSHADVACIECHYEPGAVETFEGKFKALSQVAKYLTRTAGTKPWAEVSDASCMRSGCHSTRMLEGEIAFGRVKFDHRKHLLESRRGRRLRCVSCHSQVVQGEHVSVTENVCFMCHFMPDAEHQLERDIGDCMVCHGPPAEGVEVAGREFVHADYVKRGVNCRECHDPVVEGDGTVRKERCHSCHGEVGHIERIGEQAFLHEMHVTEHKVECFECHDEIHHGLLPLEPAEAPQKDSCGQCHVSPHDGARSLYSGTGAIGVPDEPSRMYLTRVVCEACHTGRSGYVHDGDVIPGSGRGHANGGHAGASGAVAAAGEVDCIHCHGTGFEGMLGRWQGAVSAELERLEPALAELGTHLGEGADPEAQRLADEARWNLELVRVDGSLGVHNPDYALDVLAAAAERIQGAFRALETDAPASLAVAPPFRSEEGCSTCHLGIEEVATATDAGQPFSHASHVSRGLDCKQCHVLTAPGEAGHGAPSFPRDDCMSCHHQENDLFDASDCTSCHSDQQAFVDAAFPGADIEGHAVFQEKECTECHGEPPDLMVPGPKMCVLCHDENFESLLGAWQSSVGDQLARLEPHLAEVGAALGASPDPELRALVEAARNDVACVRRAGAGGVHNVNYALDVLQQGATDLDAVLARLGRPAEPALASGFPYRSPAGCTMCHVDAQAIEAELPDGRTFPHAAHLAGGIDCATCHTTEQPYGEDEHGKLEPAAMSCVSCHHEESDDRDVWDCAACHAPQSALFAGEEGGLAAGLLDEVPVGMSAEKECTECHGEPPELMIPGPQLCVLCHEEGYDTYVDAWQKETDELVARVQAALAAAEARGVSADKLDAARARLAPVLADGTHGVHNAMAAKALLEAALADLDG
ncbi:MAG: cytochrome c3 family protein [Planctomycetes bacterium]|nr:cytochrome c3 family protein [Planctomycetota bacterium]